jgi:predicted deacylase
MRVETLGPDAEDPGVAAVGAIHGDEPCGARAVERFIDSGPTDELRRPVTLVVANERALSAGRRYVETDLNRVFPGDPESEAHEERLAADLLSELGEAVTLGFHSTVSFSEPFGTLADPTPRKARIMRALPVAHAADFTGVVEGRSVNRPGFVNVEAGRQGTEAAAENAYDCLLAFLRATGALPGDADPTPTTCYRVADAVRKEPGRRYCFEGTNFTRVPDGEVYARSTDGEHVLRADGDRWPVLMSADGHETLLGYTATAAEPIADAAGDGTPADAAAGSDDRAGSTPD